MYSNSTELDVALRRNRGAQIRSGWLTSLSNVCGVAISPNDLLDIEETARLKKSFYDKVKTISDCKEWSHDKLSNVILHLNELISRFYSVKVILFSDVDQYIGAVILDLNYMLNNVERIWNITKEDFSIATIDLEDGICLEHNFYRCDGLFEKDGVYQLKAWGIFHHESTVEKG